MRRAVFIDRDGVINRSKVVNGKPYAPRQLADFFFFPKVALSVAKLKEEGFLVVVVTNQPDIGNGLVSLEVALAMNERVRQKLKPDDLLCCIHRQDEGCSCRKPKPGMLLTAARRWDINLKSSYMVGDRASDVIAGQSAGCYTILVDRGYADRLNAMPDIRVSSLMMATRHILLREKKY